ncbi:MAG: peptidylprolyl isomerase [Flavobacteriales bacterium]|nr:peptidylprolyl isomerase [Flavobacteriales bacterium]
MAVLEKIRSVQWLLFLALVLLGIGMIGFLVPFDAVQALLGQGNSQSVGEVDGTSISVVDYQTALQTRRDLFNYTNNQSLETEVWNDLIEKNILTDDYMALGLDVNQEEFDEIRFGEHISPYMQRTFYQGGVTPEAKDNWRNTFSQMYNDEVGPGRKNYEGYANVIVSKRLREKYNTLVERGIYANTLEAKYEHTSGQEKVNIDYVFVKYDDIPDSVVTVSDSDVRAYYNQHKDDPEYRQQKGRNIEFIKIPVEASQADIDAINATQQAVADEWRTLEDDSAWVSGQAGRYIARSMKEKDALTEGDKALFAAGVGNVVGPYEDAGVSKVAKIVRIEELPDSSVSCRHILLKSVNKNDAAEIEMLTARADSIKRRYKAGEDWDDLCQRFSEDPGSASNGGVYENFPRGQMVKPFENYCFDNPVGSIGAVETNYGIHLIEVTGQQLTSSTAQIAEVSVPVDASTATKKGAYNSASDFAINFNTLEAFQAAADTMGYAVTEANNLRQGASNISTLRNASEVVGWAFQSELGEVSNPILIGNEYVIAALSKVMEPGTPPFENVEEEMREEATKEAKAEYYLEKLAEAANLEEAAQIANVEVKTGRNISLKNATVPGSGASQEPQVAGLAFAIPSGSMSLPIKGEAGVWVIAPTSDIIAAEEKDNYLDEQDQTTTRMRSGAANRLFNAMKEGADLSDDRQ